MISFHVFCFFCMLVVSFHIWFVSCPCLMWSLVNLCLAVFVSLSMIYLCIYSPVCSVWFGLVHSLLPGVSCLSALPCLALMSLKTIIWVYVLVSVFLVPPCCVHHDISLHHMKLKLNTVKNMLKEPYKSCTVFNSLYVWIVYFTYLF